ncbi:restriction endonuclease subunit S [Flavobacterium sp. Sd200]|uniref:restriction endonuclease subunit S n=1 Tax=Flavobacterium sp. Sd200 TaxID=2692211 RepID=UPI00136A7E31|nr:restriction endonuclease subunit S [Flavobacterium sp. Sd200]MXN90937.1 restriction endonuclease subunit S [Flavobacterium sp. Sd200]
MVETNFKNTEIGIIPEDWQIIKLGEFYNVKTGPFGSTLHESDYVVDGIPIITVEHLGERGIIHKNMPMVSEKDYRRLISYSLTNGDIVFSRVGSVDRNSLIKTNEDGWLFSGRLLRLRSLSNLMRSDYLSYYFQQEEFKQRVRSVAVGQTMASLNTKILKDILVSYPTNIDEQKAIATALSDADNWIESLEQLIAKKRLIKQGAMQELLTPKEDWEVKKLGEISSIYTGKKNNQDKIENGIYPFFVRSQFIERINSYSFDGEAILVPGEGNIGKIFHYINGKFDFHQRVYKISNFSEGYSGEYIYRYISEHFGKHAMENSVKATVDSLRLPTFQIFEIPFPPTFDAQKRIANILSDMDAEIDALEQKLQKAQQIKQGMMQQLLTGKIRLIKNTAAQPKEIVTAS